jgi:integrase
MFLTPEQVAALVAGATPWPFSVMVHLAAWSGLRAAELAGLQVGDLTLPKPSINPNAPAKPGTVRVERTIAWVGGELMPVPPKTKGSRRTVPLTGATTALLRDYLAVHPRRNEPTAPLFPNVRLRSPRPTGLKGEADDGGAAARRQATALADLSTAEAGERLVLDWTAPNRHATFYKAVFRPAILRANRIRPDTNLPRLKFHALRHTYASLCIAAGRPLTRGRAVHGSREGHHDARRLRAPVRRRLCRRDGGVGCDGGRAELPPERGAALGLAD